MADTDFEEGEIEGLVNDVPQAKVGSCAATRNIHPKDRRNRLWSMQDCCGAGGAPSRSHKPSPQFKETA